MFEKDEFGQKKINKSLVYAILGVVALIVAVSGSAYAYYAATTSNNSVTGTAGGGAAPTLTVTKENTSTGNLIPIDMTAAMLTNAAKGSGNTGTTFDAAKACKDKNGYLVCQIYSVTVKNNSANTMSFNIGITALSGTNTPNIDAVKMASNVSVTDITSIKSGKPAGIASAISVGAGATSTKYYFMVFIKNLSTAQTDHGSFTGTITATSTTGAQVKAQF